LEFHHYRTFIRQKPQQSRPETDPLEPEIIFDPPFTPEVINRDIPGANADVFELIEVKNDIAIYQFFAPGLTISP